MCPTVQVTTSTSGYTKYYTNSIPTYTFRTKPWLFVSWFFPAMNFLYSFQYIIRNSVILYPSGSSIIPQPSDDRKSSREIERCSKYTWFSLENSYSPTVLALARPCSINIKNSNYQSIKQLSNKTLLHDFWIKLQIAYIRTVHKHNYTDYTQSTHTLSLLLYIHDASNKGYHDFTNHHFEFGSM